jgi:hypothetical protein
MGETKSRRWYDPFFEYALEIEDADKYWKSCGITATTFLGAVAFSGWRYQRRLRDLFKQLVNDIGDPKTIERM